MKKKLFFISILTSIMMPMLHAEEVISDTQITIPVKTDTVVSEVKEAVNASIAEATVMNDDFEKKLSAYPLAEENYTRHIITLPKLENEDNVKIELAVGKTLEVDCNIHRLLGSLEEKTIDGWGYSYIMVSNIEGPISTMMACPNPEKIAKFISIIPDKFYRYNSKLPLVVYVPSDTQVKYRLWTAENDWKVAE